MLTVVFKNDSFGSSPNLHKRILLVEVYRFGQCLGWRFSPKSFFFSLVSSRAFRDAPPSRFRCGDPPTNAYLTFERCPPQIYTRACISLVEVYRFGRCSKSARPGYAQCDFDQLWVDFQELGRYLRVPVTLNLFEKTLLFSELDRGKNF